MSLTRFVQCSCLALLLGLLGGLSLARAGSSCGSDSDCGGYADSDCKIGQCHNGACGSCGSDSDCHGGSCSSGRCTNYSV